MAHNNRLDNLDTTKMDSRWTGVQWRLYRTFSSATKLLFPSPEDLSRTVTGISVPSEVYIQYFRLDSHPNPLHRVTRLAEFGQMTA